MAREHSGIMMVDQSPAAAMKGVCAWRWAEGNEDRGVSIDVAGETVPGAKRSRLFLPLSLSLRAEPIKGAPLPLRPAPTVSGQKT